MSSNEGYRLLPPEQWIASAVAQPYADAEVVDLIDPVDGAPIDPSSPPPFLLNNGRLRDGYDFLREASILPDLRLGIFYTPGDESAKDLDGQTSGGQTFEQLIADPDNQIRVLGYTAGQVMRVGDKDEMVPWQRLGRRESTYVQRVEGAAMQAAIATFCTGIEVDSKGVPAGPVEHTLVRLNRIASEGHEIPLVAEVRRTIADNVGQWYTLLSAAERTQRASTIMEMGGNDQLGNEIFLAPIHYADLTRKAGVAGMYVDTDDSNEPPRNKRVFEAILDPSSYTTEVEQRAADMAAGHIIINN